MRQVKSLTNRFAAPEVPRGAISRTALLARLDAALRGALTMLVSPPGWGKSTLLKQWAAATSRPVAWLDVAQLDPSTEIGVELLEATWELTGDAGPPPSARGSIVEPAFRTMLLEQMSRLDEDTVYVIEHVDLLDSSRTAALGRLVEAAHGVHFAVTTRGVHDLSETTARLLLTDDLAVIHAADLAFDRSTTYTLLEDAFGSQIGWDTVEALLARTQGWPAALRIAVAHAKEAVEPVEALRGFDGREPRMRAYCRAEILDRLPDRLRTFMVYTSVLERLDVDVCDLATGQDDAASILPVLEAMQLVEHCADGTRGLCHRRLLASTLEEELRTIEPEAPARILRRAARRHARAHTIPEVDLAVRYAARAGNWAGVWTLAREHTALALAQGRMDRPLRWLAAIPLHFRKLSTARTIMEAFLLAMVGDMSQSQSVLAPLSPDELPVPDRYLATVLRALWVQGHVPPAQAIAAADDALALEHSVAKADLPFSGNADALSGVHTLLVLARSRAEWYLGRVAHPLHELEDERDHASSPLSRLLLFGTIAEMEAWSGSLVAAEQYVRWARELAATTLAIDHPYLALGELASAHVHLQRNELDRAASALARAETLSNAVFFEAWHAVAMLERAHLALLVDRPLVALAQLAACSPGTELPQRLDVRRRVLEALCQCAVGDVAAAEHSIAGLDVDAWPDVASVAVQIALARSDAPRARDALAHWPTQGGVQDAIAHAFWSSVVDFVEGKVDEALAGLDAIEDAAIGERLVGSFVARGPHAARLLAAVTHLRPESHFGSLRQEDALSVPVADAAPHLTRRERAVLAYLAQRLTYGEIAGRLFISQNTVKSHATSIYMKLGAKGRREAVERAASLGLL